MTPLMLAVGSENQDAGVVKLLLAAGSDPTVKSDAGETALDWARKYAQSGHAVALERRKWTAGFHTGTGCDRPPRLPSADELRTMIQESTALLQQSSQQFAVQGRMYRVSSPVSHRRRDVAARAPRDSLRREAVGGIVAIDHAEPDGFQKA